MKSRIELFSGTYKHYAEELYSNIRKETYREDIGQASWLTADEYRDIFSILKLSAGKNVLEIASGSGGPAVFMAKETGCFLTGLELNKNGVSNAKKIAAENGLNEQVNFMQGDAAQVLPFADESFDVVISIDSMNHFKKRENVLAEFKRVLKPGGQLLYTDPIVITGILTNEEMAIRSAIGFFLFVPLNENERLLKEAGFTGIQSRDVTHNMAAISTRWYKARERRKDDLLLVEEESNFDGLQSFFYMVHQLAAEKRLSRFMFTAFK